MKETIFQFKLPSDPEIFFLTYYYFFTLQYCIGFAIHQHASAIILKLEWVNSEPKVGEGTADCGTNTCNVEITRSKT